MDRAIKIFIVLLTFFAATASKAEWTLDDWGFKPNIGVDVGMQKQSFENGFGEEHFRRHYPNTNFYIGTKMFKYLGLELGYEHMYRLDEHRHYYPLQPVLGFFHPVGSNDDRVYFSHAHMKGLHASLEGYLPICKRTKTDLTATAGISWLKMYYDTLMVSNGFAATPPVTWESDTRAVPRLGIGIRQMITDNFGVRLQAIWEDTSKLEATTPVSQEQGLRSIPTLPTDNYTVKPKDSYIFNLGFFLQMA